MLLLPPLFLHFALVFPDRPDSWARSDAGRTLLPLLYLPALLLGGARVAAMLAGGRSRRRCCRRCSRWSSAASCCICASASSPASAIMMRALGRVRSVTARRQLRWIVWGTALGAVPFVLWLRAAVRARLRRRCAAFELTAVLLGLVPLAFASAIVRYRLMDVEVIIKRALVYAAALAAIAAIYAVLLKLAGEVFLRDGDRDHNSGHRAAGDARRRAAVAARQERDPDRRSTASTTAIATTIAGRSSASRAT